MGSVRCEVLHCRNRFPYFQYMDKASTTSWRVSSRRLELPASRLPLYVLLTHVDVGHKGLVTSYGVGGGATKPEGDVKFYSYEKAGGGEF